MSFFQLLLDSSVTTAIIVDLQIYNIRKVEIESRFQVLVVVIYPYSNSRTDSNI